MWMRVRAIYENEVLKPLGKLNLKEGEEVEIEVKRKDKWEILRYAGILKDLSEEEERMFEEAIKRRRIFSGR